jgi:glycosyltransferase involved in cell wall biosynthesis
VPRIAVAVVELYAMELGGGNQKAQERILQLVDTSRFVTTFVVPFESAFSRRLLAAGIDVVVAPPPPRVGAFGHAWMAEPWWKRLLMVADTIRYGFRIRRVLATRRVDVYYCSSTRAVLTLSVAAWMSRVPVLFYVNGELENPVFDSIALLAAARIAFQGPANLAQLHPRLRWLFRSRLCIVPKGILLDEIFPILHGRPVRPAERHDALSVAYCGLIHRGKGIHDLIEAFGRVAERFPAVSLHVIGDCSIEAHRPYVGELHALAELHRIADRVVFTGWRADALAILSTMDIVVHPSLAEGFPTVVLEAMALGKPVVASRVGELRGGLVIEHGQDGFLVYPSRPDQIADCLARLLEDATLRREMGRRAQEKVLRDYRIERQIQGLEALWSEMARSG